MRKSAFGAFVDKKKRDTIHQLGLVKDMLEQSGMKVENFLDESDNSDDPYIFCRNSTGEGSFDGVRIYKIGDQLAFRVQKENRTHPYGSAYSLPIEDMYQDFLADEPNQEKAAKKVVEAVVKELRLFFQKSVKADFEQQRIDVESGEDSKGSVVNRPNVNDFSTMVFNSR